MCREHLHKDIIFFHNVVETVVPSIDFVETVIVNISHNHLRMMGEDIKIQQVV